MPYNRIIDVHCHLFNAQYALMELTAASWNWLWENYPHRTDEGRRGSGLGDEGERRGLLRTLEGIRDFAAYVARLVPAGAAGCERSREIALERFSESELGIGGASLLMAPLMMDIYFALDDNSDEEVQRAGSRRAAPTPEVFAVPADQRDNFGAHLDDIAALVREQLEAITGTDRRSAARGELDTILDSAREELIGDAKTSRREATYGGVELSPGFMKHMHDLEILADANRGTVFPFLAVDPRRIGALELIKMKVGQGRLFRGIKLYPPLGYLPTHPNLEPVFEHCAANDIPITLHCSDGGMQNFRKKNFVVDRSGGGWKDFDKGDDNKSAFYTAPSRWEPVLNKWRNLRINFAHFGGGHNFASADPAWRDQILALISAYPNAYADISYFVEPGLANEVSAFVAQRPILANRLMFGTDYVMVMLEKNLGGLGPYFDRFAKLDRRLLADNAAAFLRI